MVLSSWMVVIDLTEQGITIDRLRDNQSIQLTGQWSQLTPKALITVYNYFVDEGWPEYRAYIVRDHEEQFNDLELRDYLNDIFKRIRRYSETELYVVSHNQLITCCEFNNKTKTPILIDSLEWLEKDYE